MFDINEILNKDCISGDDIGRLLIYSDIVTYKRQKGEIFDCGNELTQSLIDSLINSIDSIEDADTLECYVQLRNFIKYAQAMSYVYNQQA